AFSRSDRAARDRRALLQGDCRGHERADRHGDVAAGPRARTVAGRPRAVPDGGPAVSCDDVAYDLDAYLDRELGAEAAARVRTHVRECPACARRLATRETLGRLVRTVPYHAAPDRLRARIGSGARSSALP